MAQDATYRGQVMRGEFWSSALISSVWLVAAAGLLAVVWYGSSLVAAGRATAGGLLAGIAYNWWMLRSKSLADCILAHAVTNGLLAGYVLLTGRWEYW